MSEVGFQELGDGHYRVNGAKVSPTTGLYLTESSAASDWHWWCDYCELAEAHLTEGDATERARRHNYSKHRTINPATAKQFVPSP